MHGQLKTFVKNVHAGDKHGNLAQDRGAGRGVDERDGRVVSTELQDARITLQSDRRKGKA